MDDFVDYLIIIIRGCVVVLGVSAYCLFAEGQREGSIFVVLLAILLSLITKWKA